MLTQLLEIKRRRERSLRSTLAQLTYEASELQKKKCEVLERQKCVHNEWRSLTQQEGCFNHTSLSHLRGRLLTVENEANRLARELNTLATEQLRLEEVLPEQQKLISLNLLEQEKLKLLGDI